MDYKIVHDAMIKRAAEFMDPMPSEGTALQRFENAALDRIEADRFAAAYPYLHGPYKTPHGHMAYASPGRIRIGASAWPLTASRKDAVKSLVDTVKGVPHKTRFAAKAPVWSMSGKAPHLRSK